MSVTSAFNSLIRCHLVWLHRIATRRPGATLAVSLLLFLLSLVSIATTRFEADVFQLFPARSGALQLLLDTLRWTGSANEAYFLIEGEPAILTAESERFAGRLRQLSINGQPAFKRVTYRLYEEADAAPFAAFVGRAVLAPQLFLPPEQLPAYLQRLTPDSQRKELAATVTALASQAGMGMTELLIGDPLNLRELVLPRLKKGGQALDLDPASPYFLSRDKQVLIMIAEPARPVQDMAFARQLAAAIDTARQGAKVKISCAGAHVSAAIDEATMKGEILGCILSSLVVVLALFFFTYRRWLPTLLLPLIIAWGVALALGLAGAFLASVHIIAFAFMALIIGLGTDYSIHLYDRFHMERCTGADGESALELAVIDTGHGIFTAATTTALPFLCLAFSDVRALSELGLLVGLGVLSTMYATFLFLPPLLLFMERRWPTARYASLPGFGLGTVWRLTGRYPGMFRIATLLAVAVAVVFATGIRFEGELKNLQPRHSEAFLTQEKIERHLAISPKQLLVAIDGADRDSVLRQGVLVDRLASKYLQSSKLTDYSSLGMLVNDGDTQQRVSEGLRTALTGCNLAAEVRANLELAGFSVEPFSPFLAGMAGLATAGEQPLAAGIDLLAASPLKGVVSRHLNRDASGYHLLSYLHYRGAEFPVDSFLADLRQVVPEARTTSIDLVSRQLTEMVRRSFLWGAALGGVLVLFLLFTHFSGLAGIGAALFPVLAGVAAMLGIMAGIDMGINFMNAMVLVTILGMGNDYGMHIAHRVGVVAAADRCAVFVQSGRAVLLSALTTIAGFGSLAFADYGALASLGWATNFGIGATAIFSLVALPAFFRRNRGGA
ncbi:MMPL family transporter [Geobacter pelophilus]|uniref:MMPL family transporter n=1 Tax=Geoanaerobacter pelophilus TaxID=60036 RepID=A0AAW4L693_9BACT|nr:MMPL family transporter [Geoanaerobacter pelophilus]MBT0663337.1 MMPL family transporter [Geoanaerobacter pelophilus]